MAHDPFSKLWLTSLVAGALVAGCAGSVGSTAPDDPGSTGEAYGELDLSGYKPAGHVVCDLINSLPAMNIGGVNINKPTCTGEDYDNFYYLGAYSSTHFTQPGTPPPSQRAQAMSDALFCALKDSAGATADGTVDTAVGRFGMASRIAVPKYDPTARQVVGQRLGTLYLFGVPMDIEDQDYVATFPTERNFTTLFLGPRTGYYMDLKSSTTQWDLGGSGLVGPFTLSLDFGQTGYFASMNNNAFGISIHDFYGNAVSDGNDRFDDALSWTRWQQTCNACLSSGRWLCDCPSSTDVANHNAFASWSEDQYRNLGDGTMPYLGAAGGVSGNRVYRNSTKNWTQLGFANGSSNLSYDSNDADPKHSSASNPSTHLNFGFGLDYDIVSLDLTLKVGFRSAMELIQSEHWIGERNRVADVSTLLDAESSAGLDAHLLVANPFPFGPDYLVDETFTILDPSTFKKADEQQPASIAYDWTNGFPFESYNTQVTGNANNAQAAHDACLAVPVADKPPLSPGNPETFLSQAVSAAHDKMWPCHVKLCRPAYDGAASGSVSLCEWNKSTHKLDCTATSTACSVCNDSRSDLCLADGTVLPAPTTGTSHGYCQIR